MAHSLKLALATTIASLAFAAPALANIYWASPGGAGVSSCSSAANACLLSNAVNAANADGDEIILTPGTYTVSSQLSNTHQISIHGEDGAARPVVDGTLSTGDIFSLTGGASLSDLEIDLTGSTNGSAVDLTGTGTLDNTIVNVTGAGANAAIFVNPAGSYTFRDTVVLDSASNAGSAAITTTSPLTLRSVTAIATGSSSRGLQMSNLDNTTDVTVDAKNVILRGTQFDIAQFTNLETAGNTLNIDYSNYSPGRLFNEDGVLNDGGHNQTAVDPVFEADGWHEAAGSPTIGAGYADASAPPFDIDGDLRYVGSMDIGADQVPLATGAQALGQTSSSASGCAANSGYLQAQDTIQAQPSYTAASDGVVTSWSAYVGAVDSSTVAELKVFDPVTHTVRAQSPIETGLTPNAVNTFTTSPGIAIHAGDSVAVGLPAGDNVYCDFAGLNDDSIATFVSAAGDPQPGESTTTGGGGGGLRVNLQAYVEPDADGDGYGDLTQDGCPSDGSTHGACPTPGGGGGGGTGGGGTGGGGTGGGGLGSGTPPTGPGPTPGPSTQFKGAHLASHRPKVIGRFALVDERCDRACAGTATLTAVLTSSRRQHAVVLGHASFRIGAAGTAHVKIKLSKRALAFLRKHGHLTAALKMSSHDATGQTVSSAARVTLKLVRPRR